MAESRFNIPITAPHAEVNEAAKALEGFRSRIQGGEAAIRELAGAQRRLVGTTAEIVKAKDELGRRISSERAAISAATIEITRAGSSYDVLAKKHKAAGDAASKLAEAEGKIAPPIANAGAAFKALGGPLGALPERFENFKKAMSGANAGAGIAAIGIGALVLVVAAAAAAFVAGAVAVARFALASSGMARSATIAREAATGSAAAAEALGGAVDALARKIATPKGELAELGNELALSGLKGEELADTFAAVGQASAALGKEAGSKLKAALEKSRKGELLTEKDFTGTGLDAAAVNLEGGAKAIRQAVEKQFGGINARKLLDLNVQAAKFEERLRDITGGINLEKLLSGLAEIGSIFDATTPSGRAIKDLITAIGNGLGDAATGAAPIVKGFLKLIVIGALQAAVMFLVLKRNIRETFGDSETMKGIDLMGAAILGIKVALALIAVPILLFAVAVKGAIAPFVTLWNTAVAIGDFFKTTDWAALGGSIVDGLILGVQNKTAAFVASVTGLATQAKDGFAGMLGIKSPSKVFAAFGANTAEGFAMGVEGGAGDASAAVNSLGAATPDAAAGGAGGPGGGAGGARPIEVHFHIGGGGDPAATAAAVSSASVLGAVTKVLEDILLGAGIPVSGVTVTT